MKHSSLPTAGPAIYNFLTSGGEMGELTRSFDWAATSLGPIETWPQSLRTTVSIVLHSKSPMFLFWGSDLIQFYNDAFRPSLGNGGKHPIALGQKAEECWPEIWDFIKPIIDHVLAGGEANWNEDQLLPIYRNGSMEDVYWTFSYSAVYNETGDVGGVFVAVTESTEKVKSISKLKLSDQRFDNLISQASVGIIVLSGEEMRIEIVNEAYGRLISLSPPDMLGKPLFDIIPDAKSVFYPLIIKVLKTGDPLYLYDQPYMVITNGKEQSGYLNVVYQPYKELDGTISGVMALCQDVTDEVRAKKKTEESEAQLRFAIDAAELGTWDYNPLTNIFTANDRLKKWFGLLPHAQVDLSLAVKVMADSDKDRVVTAINKSLEYSSGGIYDIEYAIIHPGSGKERFVRARGKATFDENKIAYRLNGTLQDITEQVLSRRKIEASEQNLRDIFAQAPVALVLFKGENLVVEVTNSKLLEHWARTLEQTLGKPLLEVLPEITGKGFDDLLRNVYNTGEPYTASEVPVTLVKNGKEENLYMTFTYVAYREPDGNISGVMAVAADVTTEVIARKKIEEAEAHTRNMVERLEIAINVGNFGSYEFMLDTKSINCNAQYKSHFGLSADDELTYDKLISHIVAEDRESVVQAVKNSVALNEEYHAEYRVRWQHGSNTLRWIRAAGRPVFTPQGKALKMVGITIDITEQKLFAEELSKKVEERTVELQRSNEDLMHFAHVTSHDLKEPVRKIKLFSNRIQSEYSDSLPDTGQLYLHKVQSATDRMLAMIEGILSYSSINASEQPIQEVDLNKIISNVQIDLEILIQEKNAVIHVEKLPAIEGSPILIQQLFYNLINNSLKFSRHTISPLISITDHSDGSYAKVVISDNGIGFEQEYQDKIFDTFTRLNSKDNYEGTGLGLALCKKIIERHGGTISATGMKDIGASFIIMMPLKQNRKSI